MDAVDSVDEPDDKPMSTEMLEYIRDRIQSHPNFNRREAHHKICDLIKKRQSECKGELLYT